MSFGEELMNLSASQFMSLMYISEHAPVTMSAIASYLRIELPSATSVINKLSRAKLIKRHASPDDRRLVLISLTERGQDLLKQAKDLRRQKIERNLALFSDREKSDLLIILQTLHNRLQN